MNTKFESSLSFEPQGLEVNVILINDGHKEVTKVKTADLLKGVGYTHMHSFYMVGEISMTLIGSLILIGIDKNNHLVHIDTLIKTLKQIKETQDD